MAPIRHQKQSKPPVMFLNISHNALYESSEFRMEFTDLIDELKRLYCDMVKTTEPGTVDIEDRINTYDPETERCYARLGEMYSKLGLTYDETGGHIDELQTQLYAATMKLKEEYDAWKNAGQSQSQERLG